MARLSPPKAPPARRGQGCDYGGLIWGPWHAPLIAAGLNYPEVNPLAAIGIFTIATIAMSPVIEMR
jgi:hypothetical protein